ncbi:hypothetical protein [Sphingorhabdus sp.]|uniref:hypothetical protein n=1 Tax=Sphingorhabdus sp. TaxID=1902408 RepID=UPI0035942914
MRPKYRTLIKKWLGSAGRISRAVATRSGKTVWQDVLPAGGQATPMSYSVDGRQYLAIMAGGHHFVRTPIGDALVVYALPKR